MAGEMNKYTAACKCEIHCTLLDETPFQSYISKFAQFCYWVGIPENISGHTIVGYLIFDVITSLM